MGLFGSVVHDSGTSEERHQPTNPAPISYNLSLCIMSSVSYTAPNFPVSDPSCPWPHCSNPNIPFSFQHPFPTVTFERSVCFSSWSCSPSFLQEAASPTSVASLRDRISTQSCYFQFPTTIIKYKEKQNHTHMKNTTESTMTGD